MNPFWEISYIIQDIRHWCLDISSAIYSSALVPDILGDWFYNLYTWLGDIQLWFADAGNWYESTIDQLQALWKELDKFLDWDYWKSVLEDIWEWFTGRLSWLWTELLEWWNDPDNPIRNFIDARWTDLKELWADLDAAFDVLHSEWDDFWEHDWPEFWNRVDVFIDQFTGEAKLFLDDPIGWLKQKWNDVIWPWALEHIPFLAQIHSWYLDHKGLISEFLADPYGFIKTRVLDWIGAEIDKHFPWLTRAFTFFEDLWEDVKTFFAGPITWLLGKWNWDTFFGWVGPFFEAAGGTEAERDEEYNKVPQVDENIDEKAKMLRDEKLYELDETWSLISPEIDKIRAKIKSEVE
jgi:hypothetical protein